MSWLKRHLPQKRWKRALLYIFSVLLILLAADMILVQAWRHVDVGYDTTRITRPLNKYGTPDYIAALEQHYGAGVTPENNAAGPLLRAMGTGDTRPEWREYVLPRLGLPNEPLPRLAIWYGTWCQEHPAVPATAASAPAGGRAREEALNEEEEQMRKAPWRGADHPRWAAYLDSQAAALALGREAAGRPRYFLPMGSGRHEPGDLLMVLLPQLSGVRQVSRALAANAMRCAGEGDVAGAQRDVLAQMKLARLLAQGPMLIERLVGIAIEAGACRTADGLASTPGVLTAAQARDLLAAIDALPPMPDGGEAVDLCERWFLLDQFCAGAALGTGEMTSRINWISNASGDAQASAPAGARIMGALVPVHYNAILRRANPYYDCAVAALRQPAYRQRRAAMQAADDELQRTLKSHGPLGAITDIGGFMMGILMPSLNRIVEIDQAARTERDLTRVALALAAYHADTGAYPDSLDALSPGILRALPADAFSERPLIYRRQNDGYVLYSVGPDGEDNGGRERKSGNWGPKYDIVVRGGAEAPPATAPGR